MKTVLITGGSRGIGKACAYKFSKEGYFVAITYRNQKEKAESVKKEIELLGGKCEIFQLDITDKNQVTEVIEKFIDKFGNIDALVNNAGVAHKGFFDAMNGEEIDASINTNLKGTIYTSQEVSKNMIKNKDGAIINISSMWGVVGASTEAVYSAAKSAVIGLTKALAKELGLSNIRVNCVAPGVIDTDMNKCLDEETIKSLKDETPLQRIGEPEDVANAVYFLASENASFITGQTIVVDGGFSL